MSRPRHCLPIRPSVICLWTTRIPELLTNIWLAASVACLTLLLGVSTAWLVTRVEFPGVGLEALILPLAMPTYVLAYIYCILGFGGPVDKMSGQLVAGP